jgi:hypothetical protein
MANDPKIVDTDRLHDGALIMFSDGRSAVYSAALLLSVFDKAEAVPESLEDDETDVAQA